jgi:hypothetical protein
MQPVRDEIWNNKEVAECPQAVLMYYVQYKWIKQLLGVLIVKML